MAIKFKVTTELAGFTVGVRIAGEKAAEYVRLAYNTENPEEQTTMDNASILSVLEGVESEHAIGSDDWMADAFEAITEAVNAGDDESEAEGAVLEASLQSVVDKIAGDDEITDAIEDIVDSSNTVASGSAAIYERICELIPKAADRALIPFPGSNTGNNPDKVEGWKIVNGERKKTTVSRIKTILARMPAIKAIDDKLAETEPGKGVEQSTQERKDRDDLRADRTAAVRGYTRGLKMVAIASQFEGSKLLSFELTPADNKGKRKTYCCEVTNLNKLKEGRNLTISKFITLTSIKPTTTWAQFEAMIKRKGKKGGTTTTAALVMPTAGQMLEATAMLAHAYDEVDKSSAVLAAIKGDNDASMLAIDTVATLRDRLQLLLQSIGGQARVSAVRVKLREQNVARGIEKADEEQAAA